MSEQLPFVAFREAARPDGSGLPCQPNKLIVRLGAHERRSEICDVYLPSASQAEKSSNIANMSEWPEAAIRKLAHAVKDRRRNLGLTQVEVWHAGGPSNSTLTAIESGTQPRFSRSTLRKLDDGLQWERGTAASILADAEPALVTGGGAVTAASNALADVPTSTLAEIVRAAMDELQRRLRAETGTSPARFSPREGTPPL